MALKIALVHDWLTNMGGGERVLWELHQMYPDAPIYTSVFDAKKMPQFADLLVKTSFLQHWPLAKRKHQLYSVLRPQAFESFDFSGYDVVISTTSSEAKGIITNPGTLHVSYIFTPTRYYWSGAYQYLDQPGFGALNSIVRLLAPPIISKLRGWDFAAAQRPDRMVGISGYVNRRIEKYYRRKPDLIYPPVDVDRFEYKKTREEFYVVVSRLIPYKRVDLVVAACKKLKRKLIVVGDGSELDKLKHLAGPQTTFSGRVSDEKVADLLAKARGFIFTAEEDFGIAPIEAMAAGCPVIAYRRGGALETVIEGQSGTFFDEQTVDSLTTALKGFEAMEFDAKTVRKQAEKFSNEHFAQQVKAYVEEALKA